MNKYRVINPETLEIVGYERLNVVSDGTSEWESSGPTMYGGKHWLKCVYDDKLYIRQAFTGLSDKNGVEIYLSDLVRAKDGTEWPDEDENFTQLYAVVEVFWEIDSWKLRRANGNKWDNGCSYGDWDDTPEWDDLEVIGNRITTPELLK